VFGKCPAHVWSELNEREQLAVFASTKSWLPSRENQEGQGTKWIVVVDGLGVPLGEHLHSASPAEVRLAEMTLATTA
jgi:hypothetical protein